MPHGRRPWSRRRPGYVATFSSIGTTVATSLPVFLVGGLSAQLAQIGLTASALGLVVAVYWVASALCSPSAGRLAGRFGPRAGMSTASALGAVSLILIAVHTPSWEWLIAWLALAGAGNALGHPPSNALIGWGVSLRRRALAYGIKQAAVPLATFCAGLAVPTLGVSVGWSGSFVVAGVLTALVVAAVVWFVPDTRAGSRSTRRSARGVSLPPALRPYLILASLASALGAAQSNSLGAFTVLSAVDIGIPAVVAGVLLSAASLANVIARPLVGWLADRGIGGSMRTVAMMMAVGAVGVIAMSLGIPALFAVGCIFAFGFGWGWSGLLHYCVSKAAGRYAAAATGFVQSGAYVGSASGPFIMGFVFDHFGVTIGWISAAAFAVAAACAALVADHFSRRAHGKPLTDKDIE